MDPLESVKRVSDPVAYVELERDGKQVILLGDVHIDNKSACSGCRAPACLNYSTLINHLDAYSKKSDTDYDVFLEVLMPPSANTGVKKELQEQDVKGRRRTRRKGQHLRIQNVRAEFLPKTYFHDRPKTKQRYHYTDVRMMPVFRMFGFFMDLLHNPDSSPDFLRQYYFLFQQLYPTKQALIRTVLQLCFSNRIRALPQLQKFLPETRTKIAKQVGKLSPGDAAFVRRYFTGHLHRMLRVYNYQSQEDFATAIIGVMAMFMDVYLIARFLYYFRKQNAGGTTVLFSGLWHTAVQYDCLTKWGMRVKRVEGDALLRRAMREKIDQSDVETVRHCLTLKAKRK